MQYSGGDYTCSIQGVIIHAVFRGCIDNFEG